MNQPGLPVSERLKALALERLLLIIGEALTRIRGDEPNVFDSIPSGPEMIGMRNVIVHGYDVIDQDRIQDAVRDDLPQLLNCVRVCWANSAPPGSLAKRREGNEAVYRPDHQPREKPPTSTVPYRVWVPSRG